MSANYLEWGTQGADAEEVVRPSGTVYEFEKDNSNKKMEERRIRRVIAVD